MIVGLLLVQRLAIAINLLDLHDIGSSSLDFSPILFVEVELHEMELERRVEGFINGDAGFQDVERLFDSTAVEMAMI